MRPWGRISPMITRRRSSGGSRKSLLTWTLPEYVKKIEADLRQIQQSSGLRVQEATITVGVTSGSGVGAGAGISVFEISGNASHSQSKTVTLKVSLDEGERIQIATSNREVREALLEAKAGGPARKTAAKRAPARKTAAKRAPARKTAAKRAPARKTAK